MTGTGWNRARLCQVVLGPLNARPSRLAGTEQHRDFVPARELDAVDLDRRQDPTLEQRERGVEAQQLLDGARHQRWLRAQAREGVRVTEQATSRCRRR